MARPNGRGGWDLTDEDAAEVLAASFPDPPIEGMRAEPVVIVDDPSRPVVVCPRCSNDLPICTDTKPDGGAYSHAETCATYTWADDLCADCSAEVEKEEERC